MHKRINVETGLRTVSTLVKEKQMDSTWASGIHFPKVKSSF